MKQLWAPWRMPYLKETQPKGCIFCSKVRQNDDRSNLILHRRRHSFVMMNLYPYSNGHLLVTPYRHVGSIEDLDPATLTDLMRGAQESLKALRRVFRPDAFNLGVNQGREAGAGIEAHVHLHIVPRWNGDTNFMPVLNDTRVIPEHLESSYDKLRPLFPPGRRKAKVKG
ncbi:MAG TPA: HIT domain-containing protein [Nitrospiria bacterium]|jgi:ATP adenylyltransferase|nr:HIT domain-containing protein [Nitrospiria bacterium]